MARVVFTQHLRAVGPKGEVVYGGETLGDVLSAVFADYPILRGYILDDQGRVRQHIAIFVDGALQEREAALGLPMIDTTEVYVLQALSGG